MAILLLESRVIVTGAMKRLIVLHEYVVPFT